MTFVELLRLKGISLVDQLNLPSIDLSDIQLRSLPPELVAEIAAYSKPFNHTSLFLNDNQLTSLPPEIGALTNLEYLEALGALQNASDFALTKNYG